MNQELSELDQRWWDARRQGDTAQWPQFVEAQWPAFLEEYATVMYAAAKRYSETERTRQNKEALHDEAGDLFLFIQDYLKHSFAQSYRGQAPPSHWLHLQLGVSQRGALLKAYLHHKDPSRAEVRLSVVLKDSLADALHTRIATNQQPAFAALIVAERVALFKTLERHIPPGEQPFTLSADPAELARQAGEALDDPLDAALCQTVQAHMPSALQEALGEKMAEALERHLSAFEWKKLEQQCLSDAALQRFLAEAADEALTEEFDLDDTARAEALAALDAAEPHSIAEALLAALDDGEAPGKIRQSAENVQRLFGTFALSAPFAAYVDGASSSELGHTFAIGDEQASALCRQMRRRLPPLMTSPAAAILHALPLAQRAAVYRHLIWGMDPDFIADKLQLDRDACWEIEDQIKAYRPSIYERMLENRAAQTPDLSFDALQEGEDEDSPGRSFASDDPDPESAYIEEEESRDLDYYRQHFFAAVEICLNELESRARRVLLLFHNAGYTGRRIFEESQDEALGLGTFKNAGQVDTVRYSAWNQLVKALCNRLDLDDAQAERLDEQLKLYVKKHGLPMQAAEHDEKES